MKNNNEEHKLRERLIVKGYVQGVGYRNIVMRVARQMNVLGVIRNLDNGDIEIFCKYKNSRHLTEFIEKISIKNDPSMMYSPNVKEIERHTAAKEIDDFNPPNEFGFFKIDYGKVSKQPEELLLKMDTGSNIMLETATNVKNMHNDMTQSFNALNNKYDSIGQELKSVHNDLKLVGGCFKELVQFVTKEDKTEKKQD